jgi:hypothetical protein
MKLSPITGPTGSRSGPRRGVVLLEVVLALVLFVGAAAVISTAINASLEGVVRQRLNTHAVDLAITVMSELQIGLRAPDSVGPEPFAVPFEHWTWQLILAARGDRETEPSGLTLVEVVVRHDDPPVVYRLAQVLKLEKPAAPPTKTGSTTGSGSLRPESGGNF